LSIVASDLSGKTLELLKSVVPRLARVVVFENSVEPGNAQTLRATREAAEALGVSLQVIDVRSPADIEPAFLAATRGGADALVVLSSPLILFHRAQIAGLAATHRLPAIYPYADVVDAGGLMTYGVVFNDLFRRAAGFVPCGGLRRQDSQGSEARGPAGRTADEIRTGHQPGGRETHRARHSGRRARARGSDRRLSPRGRDTIDAVVNATAGFGDRKSVV